MMAAALALITGPDAFGHATVQPASSRPADLQIYTLTVPNEREVATDSVALQIPEGIEFVLKKNAPGWKVKLERRGDRVATLRWTGGTVPPDSYDSLQFIARNPVREGAIVWKVVQRYSDGETARWIGPAGSESPASRTRITESATREDVVSVHGEEVASAAPPQAPRSQSSGDDDDLPIILALVAIGIALVALAAPYLARRDTS